MGRGSSMRPAFELTKAALQTVCYVLNAQNTASTPPLRPAKREHPGNLYNVTVKSIRKRTIY